MENLVLKILEKEEEKRNNTPVQPWGMSQRTKLVNLLENNGAYISESVWDLLLFNVNELILTENGNIDYKSYYKASKKLIKLFTDYKDIIKENFDYIIA